jgi:hypothetical protein
LRKRASRASCWMRPQLMLGVDMTGLVVKGNERPTAR